MSRWAADMGLASPAPTLPLSSRVVILWWLMVGKAAYLLQSKPAFTPCAVRNLQDLARIYIRRTLRNFINDEMQAKGIPQRAPPKRKRKRVKQRINTYVFVGNQLIPQPLDSEEDEKMEEDNKEEEEKDHSEAMKPEEPPQNLLREKIMKLPLPESLKAYLTYFRDK
ncbi:protein-L-isoaspartate O-methyltransferase domain-containing protein 1 isoform X4 [Macaca fascicularis]|uniref:protein-L-isoaspartate O-methyltransferase domain-containing protein 1 isoform X3 n=1 Tax=Macaca mulatta TaxID=9544 RepID=UPI000732BDD6|nr:protein-L-isoaspartate O-methyltransferase domain-containing protein 1 isoform X3 [Macaca mulatta]